MIAFVIRRLLQSIAVMLTVGLIAFSLFNYVGDPINNMIRASCRPRSWAVSSRRRFEARGRR